MFDQLTTEKLGYYVYALISPIDKRPFYIGKGTGNRVFSHINCALKEDHSNLKFDTIRSIISSGYKVEHLLLRHGLTEDQAFEIEATLIDFGNYFGYDFANLVEGHHSKGKGLMTCDEIIRLHNAPPLTELSDPVIIININRQYGRGKSADEIYKATKEAWVVGAPMRKTTKYALAEYAGIIIEVFEIEEWYSIQTSANRKNDRWGFKGKVADESIRKKYLNKSIAHTKKKGAANPIKYRL